jgi:hypothetical protein
MSGFAIQRMRVMIEALRGPLQEGHVEELEVLADDQARSHRVHQFQKARREEHEADENGAQAPESMMCLFHLR